MQQPHLIGLAIINLYHVAQKQPVLALRLILLTKYVSKSYDS